MLKMFSTQLAGVFNRIQEHNEYELEDGARLLAQAAASNGSIYVCGFREMAAVEAEAVLGSEAFPFVKKWAAIKEVSPNDRVLLLTRFANDAEAVELARSLVDKGIPFVAVSTVVEGEAGVTDYADVHIDLKLPKGLLPDETGNRVGYPGAMAGLFVYHALKFTLEEILRDWE